ncbi:MAG: hypothetical protein V7740_15210 [Pseudomonas marincola]
MKITLFGIIQVVVACAGRNGAEGCTLPSWPTRKLDGLLRAISFLGLGVYLIGLGFLFQRFGRPDEMQKMDERAE